jgi:type IV secretion system protein VirB6
MALNCPIPGTGSGFLSGTLYFIDCATQTLAAEGYRALAASTSNAAAVFALLLMIFVAATGFRMLGGRMLTGQDLLLATLKLGVVLTLAGSWGAYKVLVYDPVLLAPAELMADLAQPAGLGGGDLIGRLQAADDGIMSLTRLGSGYLDVGNAQGVPVGGSNIARTPIADSTALAGARIGFLGATIAVFGTVRLLTGLLLALGPLFAGLLLFDVTRGLFVSWASLLFGMLIGALAVTAMLEIEMALLVPWLSEVLTLRLARTATASAPAELLVLVLAFAAVQFIGLHLIWRLVLSPRIASAAAQLSLPDWGASVGTAVSASAASQPDPVSLRGIGEASYSDAPAPNARPLLITSSLSAVPGTPRVPQPGQDTTPAPVPLGQSYRRDARGFTPGDRRRTRTA